MINKIKLIILLILIIIIGCEQPSKHIEISKEEGKIMSLLVDSMATSFPIPPPPPKDGSKPKPINIDSIRKVKVEVVIDTIMFPVSKHIEIDKKGAFTLTIDLFKKGGGERESQRLGVPLLGKIPLSQAIMDSTDSGAPITFSLPDTPDSKIFSDIVLQLENRLIS